MKLLKRTWADVSLDNLTHNYTVLRQQVPGSCRFLGVVKADAYGHGAVPVSHHLEELGAEFLAVSNLEEAVQLRRGEVHLPILILGYTPALYARDMAEMEIRQEVHSLAYARELEARLVGTDCRLRVHLKLDTGMARLGFFCREEGVLEELLAVTRLPHLIVEGMFTHFPVADSLDPADVAFTKEQYRTFRSFAEELEARKCRPEICHCCNSGATILYPEFAMDMIRPGIATYGISPAPELAGRLDLRPLLTLRTTISQIRQYPAGVSVSYGRSYVTPSPRTIAVVSIGYADGLSRKLSGQVSFLLRGVRVPVVGRICMDMCMVDVTDVPGARVGDKVTVLGAGGDDVISVCDLAEQLDTIPYEILCGINKRIPRIYLDGKKQTEILQYIV
ncbi:MAG: alanine racemase [Candidatus Faecousia sp.]|nr:alanine racemase [Clostridiales bacterium]MDD7652494.1 alanine racemase [Bacillota bacterium]MDY4220467.1 alanine racemase [Candidatus Faecousia sp.]